MKGPVNDMEPADQTALLNRIDELTAMVTELREANEHLVMSSLSEQTLRDAAEHAQHRQNEFLAMLAHELRNPLAPISMAGALLSRIPDASPELQRLQAVIQRQVTHLSRLLDDLLDAARINTGKISMQRKPLGLVDLIGRAVDTVQVRLLDRNQALSLDMPEELIVDADPVRLTQVFSNLLVNASKYTQDGGTIHVAVARDEAEAVVTIRDNGAGMDPDVIPHIFSMFTQGPRELARAEGGLGVGLNVVRTIVKLHGGQVSAVSAGLLCGSEFTVRLPLSQSSEIDALLGAPDKPARARRRILLIEDNRDANDVLRMVLTENGHEVTTAFDGIAGLGLARSQPFDVLICDIGLPGMDGLELIARLRRSAVLQIPFAVAISGYGKVEDRANAIAAGFGHYLVKPFDVDNLLTLIASDAVSRCISSAAATR
jgi:signal transduction histidine kinase/CheY-like chemotaxis protein